MDPISAISTAITSIKTATEIAQLLKVTDQTYSEAEYRLKFADLINALADAKISIAEMKSELQERDDKIRDLERSIEKSDSDELANAKQRIAELESIVDELKKEPTNPRMALFNNGEVVKMRTDDALSPKEFTVIGKTIDKIVVVDTDNKESRVSPDALSTSQEFQLHKAESAAAMKRLTNPRGSSGW